MEQLRERARRLIANARQGMTNASSLESSLSSSTNSTNNVTPQMMSPSESLPTTQQSSNDNSSNVKESSTNQDQSGKWKNLQSTFIFNQKSVLLVKLVEFNFYQFKTCETPSKSDPGKSEQQKSEKQKTTSPPSLPVTTKTTKKSNNYNDFPSKIIINLFIYKYFNN